jgi:hypothetical protein
MQTHSVPETEFFIRQTQKSFLQGKIISREWSPKSYKSAIKRFFLPDFQRPASP